MTETATLTLTDFLLARIAEDEAQIARETAEHAAWVDAHVGGSFAIPWFHADRLLAECEAKRQVAGMHDLVFWGNSDGGRHGAGCSSCHATRTYPERGRAWVEPVDFPCPTLRALAAVYADHPDYRDEWAA